MKFEFILYFESHGSHWCKVGIFLCAVSANFQNLLSLFFSDTICDLGGVDELANYGEYSGAPSEQQTYDYAKTILSLMTREKHPQGEFTHHLIRACFPKQSQKK